MSEEAPLSRARIRQIAIHVHDLPRAVRFYRESLGLAFLFEVPGLAFFDCGGVRLMLSSASEPRHAHPSSILYFLVSDIRAAHRELERRGVRTTSPPARIAEMPDHDLWISIFEDTEGNTLALMSEVRDRPGATPRDPG